MKRPPRSFVRTCAGIIGFIVALATFPCVARAQTVEYFTYPAWIYHVDQSAQVSEATFDFPFIALIFPGTVISGDLYASTGLTMVQRDGLDLNMFPAFSPAAGFYSHNGFGGGGGVVSSSGAYYGSNPALSDNVDFIFSNPPTAAGLWIGNLDQLPGGTEVQFLGSGDMILASEVIHANHTGVVQTSNPQDNGIFYGVTSDYPIYRIRTIEPGGDGDVVCYDQVTWGRRDLLVPEDRQAPRVTIVSPSNGAVVGFQVDVSAGIIDDSSTTVTSVPAGMEDSLFPGGGPVSETLLLAPPDGPRVITVTAVDAGGLIGGTSVTVVRDTTPPTVTIDSPLEGAILSTPGVLVSVTVADLTATTVDIAGNVVGLQPGSWPASANLVLAEGLNAIQVTATDAAGIPTTVTRNVVVDLTAPVVTISSPLNGATFGPGASPILVAVSVADDSATTVASNPGGVWANLGPGGGPASGSIALTEGMNTIEVAATDAVNRTGQAFVLVNLDTTAPQVTIDSPADGANLRGVIDVHANAVDILPGSGVARIDLLVDGAPHASYPAASYEIAFHTATLPDGVHVFTAVAVDGKGNTGSASVTARVDNTPPSVSIAFPADGAVRSGNVDFVAHASDGGSGLTSVLMRSNGAPPTMDGSFTYGTPAADDVRTSQVATTVLPDGLLLLTAAATDAAGNEASASVTIVVDNTAPQKMLITPTEGSVVSGALLIQAGGNDPNLATLSLYLNGVLTLVSTTSGLVTMFPTTSLLDGPLEVKIVALDLGGNASTCIATVTIDNLAVRIDPQTLNLKSKGGAHSVTARVTGLNVGSLIPTEANAIELRVPGGNPVPSTTGWAGDDAVTTGGGAPELAVTFDRQALIAAIRAGLAVGSIPPGGPVPITLVAGGRVIGTDSVRIAGE